MIKKCTVCKEGNFDFSMSDISLISDKNPPEAEIEGICDNCSSYINIQFKAYQAEITEFDDMMNEKEKKMYIFRKYDELLDEKPKKS